MDDNVAFMELSALLTGLYDPLLNDPEDRAFNEPIGEEYARRLRGTYPTEFPILLKAYKAVANVTPQLKINDALLAMLRARPDFMSNQMVAKQIVNVWYSRSATIRRVFISLTVGSTNKAQCARDVPNLWIVGSSVFTTSATANPTLTIAALTLRTASAIDRALR